MDKTNFNLPQSLIDTVMEVMKRNKKEVKETPKSTSEILNVGKSPEKVEIRPRLSETTDVRENDGNLANNAKPYNNVTYGDVITGRLGKDEMGGKSNKNEAEGKPPGSYLRGPPGSRATWLAKIMRDKIAKDATAERNRLRRSLRKKPDLKDEDESKWKPIDPNRKEQPGSRATWLAKNMRDKIAKAVAAAAAKKSSTDTKKETKEQLTVNEGMSDDARELHLHADNNQQLYKTSHVPIAKNLEKKFKNGTYDHEKAKTLWKYHADRASKSYEKEHGHYSPGKHAFSPKVRKEVADHMANNHKSEMEAGNMHEGLMPYPHLDKSAKMQINRMKAREAARAKNDAISVAFNRKEKEEKEKATTKDLPMRDEGFKSAKMEINRMKAREAARAMSTASALAGAMKSIKSRNLRRAARLRAKEMGENPVKESHSSSVTDRLIALRHGTRIPGLAPHHPADEATHVVTFQKGNVVGARSRRSVYVNAKDEDEAYKKAKKEFADHKKQGYKLYNIWNIHGMDEESINEKSEIAEAAAIRQYAVYHKDYSTAVQTAIKQAESRGFEVDMDDWHNKVATGPRKPDAGKTNSFSIDLKKDGKESKKKLHLQVYNGAPQQPPYELNMYIQ